MTLRELQILMKEAIAKQSKDFPKQKKDLSFITDDKDFSREFRIGIYQTAWFLRLKGALEVDFPVLKACLKDKNFTKLTEDYLFAHPSTSYTLSDLGSSLSDFLDRWTQPSKKPWHADLARIEWAMTQSFTANYHLEKSLENQQDESQNLSWNLSQVFSDSPEQIERLRFSLAPSVFLHVTPWQLRPVWARKRKDPLRKQSHYLIYRYDDRVYFKTLSLKESVILKRVKEGCSLGELLDLYCNQRTVTLLLSWAQVGIIKAWRSDV